MELAEKLRRLRKAESARRGLWRLMTQHEVTRAMRQEIGVSLSQAYLSQLESGTRAHLTSATREALARFYHVHPGYLMDDPPAPSGALEGVTLGGIDGAHDIDATSLLDALSARLIASPDRDRLARMLDWLLRLSPDELAALERRVAAETSDPA
ncbi:MAG TPA: hypothetical protein VF812_17475 [Ktedonobacterales bacterium]